MFAQSEAARGSQASGGRNGGPTRMEGARFNSQGMRALAGTARRGNVDVHFREARRAGELPGDG